MNYFTVLQIAAQIAAVMSELQKGGKKYTDKDVLLYLACRELAKRLESRNKGIAQTAGYSTSVSDVY